jgi:hypothetical protein
MITTSATSQNWKKNLGESELKLRAPSPIFAPSPKLLKTPEGIV